MGKPEVLDKTPLSILEVKKRLEAAQKKYGELNFRAQRTDEYAKLFAKIGEKEAKELKAALIALEIPRFKEQYIKKLVDILPRSGKQVKNVLQAYPLTINNENLDKIAKVINDVIPLKKK